MLAHGGAVSGGEAGRSLLVPIIIRLSGVVHCFHLDVAVVRIFRSGTVRGVETPIRGSCRVLIRSWNLEKEMRSTWVNSLGAKGVRGVGVSSNCATMLKSI